MFGAFYAAFGANADTIADPAFQKGRELGHAISTTQAIVEVTIGAAMIEAAASSIPPTVGGGLACAAVSGGTCAVPTGLVVTGEAVLGVEGMLLAGHGGIMLARAGINSVGPGPYAGRSIPARGPSRKWLQEEIDEINKIGKETGCHTCGTKDPGTESGNFVPDHQPPSKLNFNNEPQRLYPQCLNCSRAQSGIIRQILLRLHIVK